MFPTDTRGRFTRARRGLAAVLITFYLSLPWIKINGYPAVFLDLTERRFHLFGLTFAAQDMWLLFFVITGVGFSLFFVTALIGRAWCGWACPQTVFLENVYRRIEVWIEGDAIARRQLDAAPLSTQKLFKRGLKHFAFIVVSAVLTHLFLAYFVSLPEVWAMISASPAEHASAFAFIAIFTGVTYFIFAWFREQVCIVLCPYGRIQSALTDDHTITVGYDVRRGEPRGKVGTIDVGDCISCNRCVQTCPTGIDIRQGLQLECIACAACIDACDGVMDRICRPRGLIRYDSQNGLQQKPTRWVRPRTMLYALLMVIGAGVATWAVSTIKPANLGVTRMVGAPYIIDRDFVRNQFLVRLVNKRNTPARFVLAVQQAPGHLRQAGFDGAIEVPALGEVAAPLILQQPRPDYTGPFAFTVRIQDERGTFHLERKIEFLGPEARLLREEEAEEKAQHEHGKEK